MDLKYYLWILRASRDELLYSEFKTQIFLEFLMQYSIIFLISLVISFYYKSLIGLLFFYAIFGYFYYFKGINKDLQYKWDLLMTYKFFKLIYFSYILFMVSFVGIILLSIINEGCGNKIGVINRIFDYISFFI